MQEQIKTRLDGLIDRGEDVTGETVKTALCLACRDFNPALYRYATNVDEGAAEGNEWLYDVTGLEYDSDEFLVRVALAAECEWGAQDQIYYDFEKLLLARADLRVMVFDGYRQPGYNEIFQVFAQYIGRCAHTGVGDAWLFGAWTEEQFVYRQLHAFE